MSHQKKIWLGVATLWPPIYLAVFLIVMFASMAGMIWLTATSDSTTGPEIENFFTHPATLTLAIVFGIMHVLTAIDGLIVFVIYIYHILNNSRLSEAQRISWVLLLITTAALAMPVYFYLHIWHEPPLRKT